MKPPEGKENSQFQYTSISKSHSSKDIPRPIISVSKTIKHNDNWHMKKETLFSK